MSAATTMEAPPPETAEAAEPGTGGVPGAPGRRGEGAEARVPLGVEDFEAPAMSCELVAVPLTGGAAKTAFS